MFNDDDEEYIIKNEEYQKILCEINEKYTERFEKLNLEYEKEYDKIRKEKDEEFIIFTKDFFNNKTINLSYEDYELECTFLAIDSKLDVISLIKKIDGEIAEEEFVKANIFDSLKYWEH